MCPSRCLPPLDSSNRNHPHIRADLLATSEPLRGSDDLSIRSGIVSDVALLRTLIQEFATFERLPVAITEEQLRQDGFGAQPKFRILIAECDGQVAGYALFFDCYSSFQGRGIF